MHTLDLLPHIEINLLVAGCEDCWLNSGGYGDLGIATTNSDLGDLLQPISYIV